MDYQKYMIDKTPKTIKMSLAFCKECGKNGINDACEEHCADCTEEEELELTIKELSGPRRDAILTRSLFWDTDGNTRFEVDYYNKTCLREVIVNAPWGQTNEIFFAQLGPDLYEALKTIVPKPFATGTNVDKIKKE